jgi:hypothetical protein
MGITRILGDKTNSGILSSLAKVRAFCHPTPLKIATLQEIPIDVFAA